MVHHATDPEADWADAILGTDSCAHGGFSRSLQAEVDVYFNDISTVTYSSILVFWQVSNAIFLLSVFTHSF
jgi:hAT family C-terminal dimerisation region